LEDDIPATLEDNNLEYKEDWEMDFEKIKKAWEDNLIKCIQRYLRY